MTGPVWAVVLLVVGAAAAVVWPVRSSRRRRRAVLGTAAPAARGPAADSPVHGGEPAVGDPGSRFRDETPRRGSARFGRPPFPGGPDGRQGPRRDGHVPTGRWPAGGGPAAARRADGRPPGRRDARRPATSAGPASAGRAASAGPVAPGARTGGWHAIAPGALRAFGARRVLPAVGLAGVAVGGLAGGPVAGAVLAGYGVLGARALLRRGTGRRAERERRRRLDRICALAADLRAGLPVSAVTEESTVDDPVPGEDRLARLTEAAVRLADRTGAPLADLLERIEADARAADRGLAAAAAQAAGARATALLLAALPLGGIGLGYGIGADPLRVLLHTPVGAVSAITAMGLQIVGLLWAERLGRVPAGVDR
ncbi:hypothetical protein ACFY3U_08990 [Micromonospora sp. NPDC000089]|uniref:hypothetical protein n=1 Tax=unclassified Micromonospora TaxID=2617518 RepID=UPI0036CE9D7B